MLKLKNKYYFSLIVSLLILLNGTDLYSQDNSGSFNSNIYATIRPSSKKDPISVQKILDLTFGDIAVTSSAGTITINPQNNVISNTGGIVLQPSVRNRAEFQLTGKKNQNFSISINQSSIVLQNIDYPGSSLNLSLTSYTIGRFNSVGKASLYVGGTLNIGANQPKGTYQATFVINVNNN